MTPAPASSQEVALTRQTAVRLALERVTLRAPQDGRIVRPNLYRDCFDAIVQIAADGTWTHTVTTEVRQ